MSGVTTTEIVSKADRRIESILAAMHFKTRMLLFDCYMDEVEYVALAIRDDQLVGIATLSPRQGSGSMVPDIIAVWVSPDCRSGGTGLQLIAALSRQSQQVYGALPVACAVTKSGSRLSQRAVAAGYLADYRDLAAEQGAWEVR